MEFNKRIKTIEDLSHVIVQKMELLKGIDDILPNQNKLNTTHLFNGESILALAYLRDSLWESIYLNLGRLVVDKKEDNEHKKTISLNQLINEYQNTHENICKHFKIILDKHASTIINIRNKRNKIIAHYDLSIATSDSEEDFNNESLIGNSEEITQIIQDLMGALKIKEFKLLSSQTVTNILKPIITQY